jgi:hypothetical protein
MSGAIMFHRVRTTGAELRYDHPDGEGDPPGIRTEASAATFLLTCELPSTRSVYFRAGYGSLEWGDDLAQFAGKPVRDLISRTHLMSLADGTPLPPDVTLVPGVRRLALGTRVQVDGNGVAVTAGASPPLRHERPASITEVVGESLARMGDEPLIAFSGGLASTFLAASAVRAGLRPRLLHVAGQPPGPERPLPELSGPMLERVDLDLAGLLDPRQVTGGEALPPLPDSALPGRLPAALAAIRGVPVAGGSLLENLFTVKLTDADLGLAGWRTLACEPFHTGGAITGLRAARAVLNQRRRQRRPQTAPTPHTPPSDPPADAAASSDHAADDPCRPVWLTDSGWDALGSARLASAAAWQEHERVLSRAAVAAEVAIAASGMGTESPAGARDTVAFPALDQAVLGFAASQPASSLGQIRDGRFSNQLPLRAALRAQGVTQVREAGSAARTRMLAAACLLRERERFAAEVTKESPLADLGLIRPHAVAAVLRDGMTLTDHALPIVRLLWLDRWLGG